MSTANRQEVIKKSFRVLKKKFKRHPVPSARTVLEHLLYGCCLENATPVQADEAFGRLQTMFFDWNEVRVTSITELTEAMGKVNDAGDAARRLRYTLHHVFEAHYQFDIEYLKKENIGQAIKILRSYHGITPFVINYVVRHGLDGHVVPLNRGAVAAFALLKVATPREAKQQKVPGLERAITKSRGVEFSDYVQQFGVAFDTTPHGKLIRETLLDIDPNIQHDLPKRPSQKKPEPTKKKAPAKKSAAKTTSSAKASKSAAGSKTKSRSKKKPAAKKAAAGKKSGGSKIGRKKPR
jgi:endonuclease-3